MADTQPTDRWGDRQVDQPQETAARMGTMTRSPYCTARKTITRTVPVKPDGGKYAPLPDPATREEVVRCEANRSDEHSCIGPVENHGRRHMCRCGWMWDGYAERALGGPDA